MTPITIILALALLCAVATANHYRRRWARAEDTNRFLVEQCNQLNERIERLSKQATVPRDSVAAVNNDHKIYIHSSVK
ncbi:MAG: hypothetical protein LIO91_08165 [Bacteroidales bacterium]|nr:hypothetical protein [Bacteroidales bacterium]